MWSAYIHVKAQWLCVLVRSLLFRPFKPEKYIKQAIKFWLRELLLLSSDIIWTCTSSLTTNLKLLGLVGWRIAWADVTSHYAMTNVLCRGGVGGLGDPRVSATTLHQPGQADLGGCLYVEAGAFPVGRGNQTVYEQLPTQKSLGRLIAQLIDLRQRSQEFAR